MCSDARALRDIYSEVHLLSQNISDLGTSFATSLAVSPPKKVPSLKVKKVVPHFDETSQSSPTSKSLLHRNNNGGVSPSGSFIEPFSADSYFDSIKPDLKNRVSKILSYEINTRFEKKWLLRNALKIVKGYLSKRIVNSVIKTMTKDFSNRNMMP